MELTFGQKDMRAMFDVLDTHRGCSVEIMEHAGAVTDERTVFCVSCGLVVLTIEKKIEPPLDPTKNAAIVFSITRS